MINVANPLMWSDVATSSAPMAKPEPLPDYYKGNCSYFFKYKENSQFYGDYFRENFEEKENLEEEEFHPLRRSNSYEILGIDMNANEAEIKQAFRKKALEFHPDKGGDPEEFIKIREAYEFLIS